MEYMEHTEGSVTELGHLFDAELIDSYAFNHKNSAFVYMYDEDGTCVWYGLTTDAFDELAARHEPRALEPL